MELPILYVLITTSEQLIEGELVLPESVNFDSPEPESILFCLLNSGIKFIGLKHCEIKDRKNLAFKADKVKSLHLNIERIITIRVPEKETV